MTRLSRSMNRGAAIGTSRQKPFIAMFLILVMAAFSLPGASAVAQSSKGILVGAVTDPAGALLSEAKIKIVNKATGVERDTVSSGDGLYRLDAVDPGVYAITVSVAGFKTLTIDNVLIASGQSTTRDVSLELGATNESITVTGDATVILQQQDGARTETFDTRQITDLPIANLNPTSLVFTLPGVNAPGQAGGFVQGTEFSINGLRPRANNQLIDGTENNDIGITGQLLQPILRDGYKEVTILGADNSAEYGRGAGALTNVITNSGSNRFHGSAYDVINTSALSSLSSGQKTVQGLTSVPVSIENLPGFSVGGPIKRDKLFFFGTMQWDRFRSGGTPVSGVVPTDQGFSQLTSLFPKGTSPNLDRYLGFVGDLRGATNIVQVPLGGGRPSIPFGSVTVQNPTVVNDIQWLARVDWTPSTSDNVSFRHIFDNQTFLNQIGSIFAGFQIDVPSENNNFLVSYTHTFSPRWVNEFRFSYGRLSLNFTPRDPAALTAGPEFLLSGTTVSPFGLNPGFPQARILNNFQYQDTITRTAGNHTLRAGVDLVRQLPFETTLLNSRGTLSFTTGGNFPTFGNFVDGFSGTQGAFGSKQVGQSVVYAKRFQQSYFVNDSWRVRPNLTLTVGLRYENYGTPENVLPFPAFAGFDAPITTVRKQKQDNNNFSPRLSFAYTPHASGFLGRLLGQDKTVIRGGYSIAYDVFFDNILVNTASQSPNVFSVSTFGVNGGAARGFANAGVNSLPASVGSPNPRATIETISPNLVNPQTHLWNFGIQREIKGSVIVDVAYVGSRGERLFINEQLNSGVNNARIFPGFGSVIERTNGGDSIYHSLQARVERGLKNGLLFRFNYTYSKAIDDVNSEVFVTSGGSSFASDPFNRRADRSVATFDAPHRAVWTALYDIPSPNLKWRPLKAFLSHYAVSGIYFLQSGAVETPFIGGIDLNGDLNGFNDRPAIVNPQAPANSVAILASLVGLPSKTNYVDANGNPINLANARFVVDPNIRTNLAGRNTLRGSLLSRFDVSMDKAIPLPFEGHKLDIRVQFFNVFNHPFFTWDNTLSNGDVTNPFFNNVRLNDGGSRSGQIQVRYSF